MMSDIARLRGSTVTLAVVELLVEVDVEVVVVVVVEVVVVLVVVVEEVVVKLEQVRVVDGLYNSGSSPVNLT